MPGVLKDKDGSGEIENHEVCNILISLKEAEINHAETQFQVAVKDDPALKNDDESHKANQKARREQIEQLRLVATLGIEAVEKQLQDAAMDDPASKNDDEAHKANQKAQREQIEQLGKEMVALLNRIDRDNDKKVSKKEMKTYFLYGLGIQTEGEAIFHI